MSNPMGIYGVIGVLGLILGLAKEILIVIILFQGIRLANIFIKKNKDSNNPPWDVSMPSQDVEPEEKDNLDQ